MNKGSNIVHKQIKPTEKIEAILIVNKLKTYDWGNNDDNDSKKHQAKWFTQKSLISFTNLLQF